MESLTDILLTHAHLAHWIIFGALMLAGLNIPISEDLMIILSATLAATVVPENTYKLFAAVFLGCYLSDWVCYWIGRKLGPNLQKWRWFAKMVKPERIQQMHQYYEKYGFWTLLIGRFIPFGVRNCLFLTAGIGKMHFGKFILSDGIACLSSNLALFSIAYTLSRHYDELLRVLKTFNLFLFIGFLVTGIAIFWYKKRKSTRKRIDP